MATPYRDTTTQAAVDGTKNLKKSPTLKTVGVNVRCTVPLERVAPGFQYIERSVMHGAENNAHRRKLSAAMEEGRARASVHPELCSGCAGWSRSGPRKDSDFACPHCMGLGVKSGDSQHKEPSKNGTRFKFEIRRCRGKGWGVYAGEHIPAGAVLFGIEGSIMSVLEAAKLDTEYKRKGLFYTFECPAEWHGEGKRRHWVTDLTHMVIASTIFDCPACQEPQLTRTNGGRAIFSASSTIRAGIQTWYCATSTPAQPSAGPC